MSQLRTTFHQQHSTNRKTLWFIALFLFIAAAGLLYVKWLPYYQKGILAANTHSIGSSILGDLSSCFICIAFRCRTCLAISSLMQQQKIALS